MTEQMGAAPSAEVEQPQQPETEAAKHYKQLISDYIDASQQPEKDHLATPCGQAAPEIGAVPVQSPAAGVLTLSPSELPPEKIAEYLQLCDEVDALGILGAGVADAAPMGQAAPEIEVVRDACQMCLGAKGGVPGNENRIGNVIMCDYCHSLHLSARPDAAPASVGQEPEGWLIDWPAPGGGSKPVYSHGPGKPSYGAELDARCNLRPVYTRPDTPSTDALRQSHRELMAALKGVVTWLDGWAEVGSAQVPYDRAVAALTRGKKVLP
jgi:hypothetical protein